MHFYENCFWDLFSLCIYICVCVYVCKYGSIWSMHSCGGQRASSGVSPHCLPCLRVFLVHCCICQPNWIRLVGILSPPPISLLKLWDHRCVSYCFQLLHGFWAFKLRLSGLHIHRAVSWVLFLKFMWKVKGPEIANSWHMFVIPVLRRLMCEDPAFRWDRAT